MSSRTFIAISDSEEYPRPRNRARNGSKKHSTEPAVIKKEPKSNAVKQKARKECSTRDSNEAIGKSKIAKSSLKKNGLSSDRRIDVDAEIIDLTNVSDTDAPHQPPSGPKGLATLASDVRLPSYDDILKVKREHCDSKMDLEEIPTHDSNIEQRPQHPITNRPHIPKLVAPKARSTQRKPELWEAQRINLVGSDSDEHERSRPLKNNLGSSNRAIAVEIPKISPSNSRPGGQSQPAFPLKDGDYTVSKERKNKNDRTRAVSTIKTLAKQKSAETMVTNKHHGMVRQQVNGDGAINDNGENPLIQLPTARLRLKRFSENGTAPSDIWSDNEDSSKDLGLRSNKSSSGDSNGVPNQRDHLSLPWSINLPQFREMWERQRDDRSAKTERSAERPTAQSIPSILKNVSSSDGDTPSKRKRAHFDVDPVDAEFSAPKAKKPKKMRKEEQAPSPTPEPNYDDWSTSEDRLLPTFVPAVKASTSETYPGLPSEMTPQLTRSTPARAARDPMIPIPEKSKVLAKSSKKQAPPSTAKPSTSSSKTKQPASTSTSSPKAGKSLKNAIPAVPSERTAGKAKVIGAVPTDAKRSKQSMTPPPSGQASNVEPPSRAFKMRRERRKERRKANSQRRAKEKRAKQETGDDKTQKSSKEEELESIQPQKTAKGIGVYPPNLTESARPKTTAASTPAQSAPPTLVTTSTNTLAADLVLSSPLTPPLSSSSSSSSSFSSQQPSTLSSAPQSRVDAPWTRPEAIQLSHDCLVFAAYLREVLELMPSICNLLDKISEADISAKARDVGVNLCRMRKLARHASSTQQMEVRARAAVDFERWGKWVGGYVRTMGEEAAAAAAAAENK